MAAFYTRGGLTLTRFQSVIAFHQGIVVCFGLCPCQHNGTYTRNVYPATPTKKPAQILRFAESKKEPLSRKILGKAARNALGKGTGPSNLPDTAVGIFLSRLKKWVQKSPEVVETSGLFAAASFLVQLDVMRDQFRYMLKIEKIES